MTAAAAAASKAKHGGNSMKGQQQNWTKTGMISQLDIPDGPKCRQLTRSAAYYKTCEHARARGASFALFISNLRWPTIRPDCKKCSLLLPV